jgi:hypothetical protein
MIFKLFDSYALVAKNFFLPNGNRDKNMTPKNEKTFFRMTSVVINKPDSCVLEFIHPFKRTIRTKKFVTKKAPNDHNLKSPELTIFLKKCTPEQDLRKTWRI